MGPAHHIQSVVLNIAVAPSKATSKKDGSSRSAWTIETPLLAHRRADEEEGERVRPRIDQLGRLRKWEAMEEPWCPVMPIMTRRLAIMEVRVLVTFRRRVVCGPKRGNGAK